MFSQMILIEDNRAPNPRRVRIFLAEKGIEVERRHIDIMAEEHKSAEMVKRNPFLRIPVLELDDGVCISEGMAICRYFEALQPEPRLFGTTPEEQAIVEMWQRRIELYLMHPIAHAFRHAHPRMAHLEVPQIPQWSEANVPKIEFMLDYLNDELAGRSFIAGDSFSVADIDALCAIDFMKVARVQMKDSQTALKAWHERVSARPSAGA
jgi:glutathione S-transferase